MYCEYFGLRERPFGLNPDPAYLFLSSQHSIAYNLLEYGLFTQSGITAITGEVGTGKTTLLRHLLDQHDNDGLMVGFLTDTEEDTSEDLFSWIMMAFGLDHAGDKIDLKKRLQEYLINNYAKGLTTILIVDEAQNLTVKALEQVRVLNNINSGRDELLKIVLVGQPELLDKLQSPELMQLAQRVTVEFHLQSLKVEEAGDYIKHRLSVAGGQEMLFSDPAVYAIYYFAGGVPRLINTLCEYALVYAYSTESRMIDMDAVSQIIRGRRIGGLNRLATATESMEVARSIVLESTGIDVAEMLSASM